MDEILVRLIPALMSGIAITYFGYWLNHRDKDQ
ncbi:type I toxin-antitoxin system Fst family toxin [Macrococcus equipercicus]|uniref:Type I toxin-antitoxin system Fst family toxin n=1 Tax=Macrococcus equipercicus TaxID=69967 RepID=A0A9Q9F0Z3_9STAP|nr:type I toxin-antitoxin system Fst family toxin [Macrococcus equipercicus]KAA1036584.1 type I toxin-antitoxin system Fst family toxin [Macrococcus equipercicus]UTH13483.1 type I toxin-antitoxin system Fst family toxin [Macrococcus equipercicus]